VSNVIEQQTRAQQALTNEVTFCVTLEQVWLNEVTFCGTLEQVWLDDLRSAINNLYRYQDINLITHALSTLSIKPQVCNSIT